MAILNKRRSILLGLSALILLIPLVAMQFTSEVHWELGDFLVMAAMLLVVILAVEGILLLVKNPMTRKILIIVAIVLFLLLWAEMAVGIFGSPLAGD